MRVTPSLHGAKTIWIAIWIDRDPQDVPITLDIHCSIRHSVTSQSISYLDINYPDCNPD